MGHAHISRKDLRPDQIEVDKGSIWGKLHIVGLVLAVAGIGGAFGAAGSNGEENISKFWSAYLTGFMFALALGLGGLFFVIVHHITRAKWGVVLRRLAENMALTLPIVAICAVPILFMGGNHHLYHWTHVEAVQADPMLLAKVSYLNETSASVRFFIYLLIWGTLAFLFWRWSVAQDSARGDDANEFGYKQRWLSHIGLAAFAFTLTFGAFDFLMSLDPHWFSTIFGVYYFATSALSVMSFLVLITVALQQTGRLKGVVTPEHFHDLGKFLFGFTIFWTYIAFSQYMLIWYANIPEETYWFSYRGHGDYLTLSLVLVFGRFVLPWFALLRRPVKRNPTILAIIAFFVFLMTFVDMMFLVTPAYAHGMYNMFLQNGDADKAHFFAEHFYKPWVDLLAGVGFLGVFLIPFGWSLANNKLVPIQDPRLDESLNHENL